MRHHTIIYNPAAGQGLAADRIGEVEKHLEDAGIDFALVQTRYMGHATELAADAARRGDSDVIVAAGGDGTVNEVINGLMDVTDGRCPDFGVLTVGRGNDFAYGVNIPTDLAGCIAVLADAHTEPLDIGHLKGGDFPDGRYFGNGIGIGFDTIVGIEATKLKFIKGFAGYLVGAFKTLLFFYETPRLRMTIDGDEILQESIQVSVMNGQRLGGAFFMAPSALTADGSFDLCIAGKPRRGQMLGLLLRYMKGTQAESPHIMTRRAKKITVEAETGSLPIHADGEIICTEGSKIEFACVPRALRVVTRSPDE